MAKISAYTIESFACDKNKEMLRLHAQLDLFWEQEHSLYTRLGLRDGMTVLDCGCGSGYLLEKLHHLYPSMICVGIEVSDFLFSSALERIESGKLQRCTFHKQSIMSLDLQVDSFDFVIVRLVLEHLPDPVTALKQVFSVLRAGGRAVFIDNDFNYHVQTYPEVPELSVFYEAYCNARYNDGGNPCIGRQLPQLLASAGFNEITLDVITASSFITGDEAFHQSEGSGIALQLLRDGYLSSDTFDRLAAQWNSMLRNKEHVMIRLLFAGCGTKSHKPPLQCCDSFTVAFTTEDQGGSRLLPCDHLQHPISEDITANLMRTVTTCLGFSSVKILPDIALGDLGIDSAGSLMLRNHIEKEMNVKIPSLEYFYSHTLNDLIAFVNNSSDNKCVNQHGLREIYFEEGEI